MVTHFVRHDIGLGKLARCAQLVAQRLVKAQVDIDLLVAGAIERTHGGLTRAAGRGGCTPKQHQLGLLVLGSTLLEHIFPDIFRVGQYGGHKLGHAVIRRWPLCGGLLAHWCHVATIQHAQNGQRVDTQRPACHQRDHDGAQPDAPPSAAPCAKAATTAIVTAVFHVTSAMDALRTAGVADVLSYYHLLLAFPEVFLPYWCLPRPDAIRSMLDAAVVDEAAARIEDAQGLGASLQELRSKFGLHHVKASLGEQKRQAGGLTLRTDAPAAKA